MIHRRRVLASHERSQKGNQLGSRPKYGTMTHARGSLGIGSTGYLSHATALSPSKEREIAWTASNTCLNDVIEESTYLEAGAHAGARPTIEPR